MTTEQYHDKIYYKILNRYIYYIRHEQCGMTTVVYGPCPMEKTTVEQWKLESAKVDCDQGL